MAGVVVVLGVVLALLLGGGSDGSDAQQDEAASQRVDGVSFTERAVRRETDCARASYGDVQAWFQSRPCTALTRLVFDTEVSQRGAAVAVAIVELPDEGGATELRKLLNTAGTGGVTDLVAAGQRWPGVPDGFDSAAQAVEQTGKQVRIVQAVWSRGYSDPDDVALRSLAERGLRLRP
ncbi:hypothetical protein ACFQ0O_06015 [Saccharopolyspora spinosporotrichia]